MDSLKNLSRREREIMDIVFARNEATLSEILDQLADPPTRPALRSLLTILEDKGHLKHRKEGREFVYLTVHSREKVGRSTLGRVVSTFFNGSLAQALASCLNDPRSRYSDEEIAELSTFVEQAKAARKSVTKNKQGGNV